MSKLSLIPTNIQAKQPLSYWLRDPIREKTWASIRRVLATLTKKNLPLKFVLYWGFGMKQQADEYDHESISIVNEFISSFRTTLRLSSAMTVIIVFTDTHAEINYIPLEVRQGYERSMRDLFVTTEWRPVLMSSIVNGLKPIHSEFQNNVSQSGEEQWQSMRLLLTRMAEKHYRGVDRAYEMAAFRYYLVNLCESDEIGKVFSNSILLTFHSEDLNPLLVRSKLPIIHLYPSFDHSKGAPWFSYEKGKKICAG